MQSKHGTIGRKLTVLMMLTSSVALLVACTTFLAYDVYTFRRGMSQDLATLADVIGSQTTAALSFRDSAAARRHAGVLQHR